MSKDIKEHYKTLKLDERASINEVILAFDVLSTNEKDINKLKEYRNAFENIMSVIAPQLFEGNDDTIEINREDFKQDKVDEFSNLEGIDSHNVFPPSEDIPITWLKEYVNTYGIGFLGKTYINVEDFVQFLDSFTLFYSTTIIIKSNELKKVGEIAQEVRDMCNIIKTQYNVNIDIKKTRKSVIVSAKVPYDLYCILITTIDDYCSTEGIDAYVSTLGV